MRVMSILIVLTLLFVGAVSFGSINEFETVEEVGVVMVRTAGTCGASVTPYLSSRIFILEDAQAVQSYKNNDRWGSVQTTREPHLSGQHATAYHIYAGFPQREWPGVRVRVVLASPH